MTDEYFDIANYTGHKALDELKMCYDIYELTIAQVLRLNNVNIQFMDFKPKTDIYEIIETTSVADLDIEKLDAINCQHLSGCLRTLRKKEVEYCINSSVFFQIMLEADINDFKPEYEDKRFDFKMKWKTLFDENNATDEIRNYFNDYFSVIYRGIRVPNVHPKKQKGLDNTHLLRFEQVQKGMMKGWFCFVYLLNLKNGLNLDYKENWKQMCNSIHQIPVNPDKKRLKKLDKLAIDLSKKASNELNKKSG